MTQFPCSYGLNGFQQEKEGKIGAGVRFYHFKLRIKKIKMFSRAAEPTTIVCQGNVVIGACVAQRCVKTKKGDCKKMTNCT